MTHIVNDGISTWCVSGESVRGASHAHKDLPIRTRSTGKATSKTGLPLVLAISDGHGSEKYFRSDQGANSQ